MNLRFVPLGVSIWACLLSLPVAAQESNRNAFAGDPRNVLPRWWKIDLELRGRFDGYQNARAAEGSDLEEYLHRLRVTSVVTAQPWLRLVAQIQDSRVAGYPTSPAPRTIADPFDLRQAYIEVGPGTDGAWNLRVGRQPLVFGDMRLVSTSNWGNVGPNFDGVRTSWTRGAVHYDAFLTEAVTPCTGFNHPSAKKKLHGFYATWKHDEGISDFYLFYKNNTGMLDHTGASSTLRMAAIGTRQVGRLPARFDYNVEMAIERGGLRDDRIAAWAGHWEIGRTVKAVRVSGEYNYATGDPNPSDNRRNSFDQLYPTNVFGTAADFGWRNLHEPVATVAWNASKTLLVRTSYHAFWLASKRDALYLFNGSVFASNPKAARAFVGNEIDTRIIWQVERHMQIYTGYAWLAPGGYLKEAGRQRAIHYPYVMWTLTL